MYLFKKKDHSKDRKQTVCALSPIPSVKVIILYTKIINLKKKYQLSLKFSKRKLQKLKLIELKLETVPSISSFFQNNLFFWIYYRSKNHRKYYAFDLLKSEF